MLFYSTSPTILLYARVYDYVGNVIFRFMYETILKL